MKKLPKPTDDVEYIVLNEHTLGYRYASTGYLVHILAAKAQAGYTYLQNTVAYNSRIDKSRPATKEDFEYFRVQPPKNLFSNGEKQ